MLNSESICEIQRKKINRPRMKELLIQELPNCFKKGEQKQPLCIGIHLQVHSHYKDDARFEPKTLQTGINKYCCGEKYLKTIIEGASRIDIDGHPVGIVTAEEAAFAQGKLQHHEEQRKKKELEKARKKATQPSKSTLISKPISLEELRKKSRNNASRRIVYTFKGSNKKRKTRQICKKNGAQKIIEKILRLLQNSENSAILRDFSIGGKKHKNGKRLSVAFLCFSAANRERSKIAPFMSFAKASPN